MEIYKKGQGYVARWITAAACGALLAFGCFELYEKLQEYKLGIVPPGIMDLTWSALISALVFIAGAIGIGFLVNYPKFVDYLISSEVELRKVSWPTRLELKRQTAVVIFVLVAFAVILLAADFVCVQLTQWIYGL